MRELAGVASLPVNQETLRFSSPLQGTSPAMARDLRQARELRLAERGACIRSDAPVAESLSGLGALLEEKFGAFSRADERSIQDARAERMRKYLAHRAHTSVISSMRWGTPSGFAITSSAPRHAGVSAPVLAAPDQERQEPSGAHRSSRGRR